MAQKIKLRRQNQSQTEKMSVSTNGFFDAYSLNDETDDNLSIPSCIYFTDRPHVNVHPAVTRGPVTVEGTPEGIYQLGGQNVQGIYNLSGENGGEQSEEVTVEKSAWDKFHFPVIPASVGLRRNKINIDTF